MLSSKTLALTAYVRAISPSEASQRRQDGGKKMATIADTKPGVSASQSKSHTSTKQKDPRLECKKEKKRKWVDGGAEPVCKSELLRKKKHQSSPDSAEVGRTDVITPATNSNTTTFATPDAVDGVLKNKKHSDKLPYPLKRTKKLAPLFIPPPDIFNFNAQDGCDNVYTGQSVAELSAMFDQ